MQFNHRSPISMHFFAVRVQPICIFLDPALKGSVEKLKTFRALGWGNRNGKLSIMLQTIYLLHLKRNECKRKLNFNLNSRQICAGTKNGDTCRGDSGGPLSTNILFPSNKSYEVQLGIVSFGDPECRGVGVYTDVTSYVDWISSTIARNDYLPIGVSGGDIAMGNPIAPDANRHWTPAASPPLPSMLYNSCSQDIAAPIAQLRIYWPGSYAVGVLITDRKYTLSLENSTIK